MHWCWIVLTTLLVMVNGDGSNGKLDWWQTSVIYQIYPRSFKDSNNDGVGDLKGIEEKADYLKELGIDVVWLSPIFKSPMADMGYDISDFKTIDPIFGTMEDFLSLQKKLQSLEIKLTLDFVPNHSSDEHDWFQKSIKKIDPYTDYYIWKDPKSWINETTPVPPNNWISLFEGSAWTYNPTRRQFYLHQFAVKQPDLNYRSKELMEEMKNVLRFWLNKGVNGFRIDAVPYLIEHTDFLDEPIINDVRINGQNGYNALEHKYTTCQPETYEVLREFRKVLESYTKQDGQTRLMMTEAYASLEETMKFYGNDTSPIAHIPFNFMLLGRLSDISNAYEVKNVIHLWMDNMPEGKWPNWVLGNHDNSRMANKFDTSSVDMLNMMLLLLPGTPITYNGEEIGMEDAKIRWDQTTDVIGINVGPKLYQTVSRDPERTPFQWDSSLHAGFSRKNGTTWLPVNPNYYRLNVENQKNEPRSHYNIYKNLIKIRSNDAFRYGDFKTYTVSKWIFAFKRSLPNEAYLIIINLNNESEQTNLNSITDTSYNYKIVLASSNSEHNEGDHLNITTNTPLRMRPKSALVLYETPKVSEK